VVTDSLRAGVDVVTYSGDKLLGGPQAGVLSGKKQVIADIRSNPMFRALRVDKLTYAALEATLMAYIRQDHDSIPALRMMRLTQDQVGRRAEQMSADLTARAPHLWIALVQGMSVLGGGSAPGAVLPTILLAISSKRLSADELAARLRAHDPAIIARVEEGRVLIDLRTVFPGQDATVADALARISQ
jgi:L-seryl-tRNA(Ser) seleniumtransferase